MTVLRQASLLLMSTVLRQLLTAVAMVVQVSSYTIVNSDDNCRFRWMSAEDVPALPLSVHLQAKN
jgi:hypothetical protein